MDNRKLSCARRPIDNRQQLHRIFNLERGERWLSRGMATTSKMSFCRWLLALWLSAAFVGLAQDNPVPSATRPAGGASAVPAAGRRSYAAHCAMCHGLDGRGGEHAAGLANSRDVRSKSDKALMQIVRGGIPASGMPSFRSLPEEEIVAVVNYVRSLGGAAATAPVKGDALRGEKVFFGKAQCGDCHMLAGRGGFMGPDLSDFAVANSPAAIREAIVRPNEKLLPTQQVIRIETVAGQSLSGLVRNEDNFSLQLQGADGTFHLLMKSQIAKLERTCRSLMPADYGSRLSSAELDDLVSFIARYGRRVESPSGPSGERPRRARQP
jgi:cytochrome c oxidase cbb3-type subunit III